MTLICDLGDGQGNYLSSGIGSFAPTANLTDATDHLIASTAPPVPVVFYPPGPPQVKLLATDNAALLPAGWAWTFTPPATSGLAAFNFFLPFTGGATQYLSALAPVSTPPVMSALLQGSLAVQVLLPTGGDDTAAYNAAVAALPVTTLNNGIGGTLPVPIGTILLGAGAFKFGSLGTNTSNIGPCVNLLGQGRNATRVTYWGTGGDAIRMFNPLVSNDRAFDQLPALHGRIDGLTIDGTNAGAGSSGLHYGDTEGGVLGPDLQIQNFSQGLVSSPTGLGATPVGTGGGGAFSAGGTFWWAVSALTRTGETMVSSSATATIASNGSASLSWTAPSGTVTGYRVYRNTSNVFANTSITLVADKIAGTAYTDTGLTLSTTPTSPVNCSGNNGLWFDNTRAWTESIYGRIILRNNSNNMMFSVQADGGVDIGPSFEYNDLTLKVYAWPKQNGIVLREGAWFQHGSLKMRANFANSNAPMQSAALAHYGVVPAGNIKAGNPAYLINSRLDIQAETNSLASGSGTNYPSTILWGDVNSNAIYGCTGILSFSTQPFWSPSNWTTGNGSNRYGFEFHGVVLGDLTLNPANDSHIVYSGGLTLPLGSFPSTTTLHTSSGDVFSTTLTGNATVAFDTFFTVAAPQRKTIIIAQPSSGGTYNYTVTWPNPGSPSLSNPIIYWPGGVPPVQSAGLGATDLYELATADGIHWYGAAFQQSVPQPLLDPWAPADAGFLAWNMDPSTASTNGTLATGVVNLLRVNIRTAVTCTNVCAFITTGGSGLTANQNFAGLYNSAGTLVAATANQTAAWAGTGLMTMPLAAGPFALTPGFYWVALLSNGTTPPTFSRSAQASGAASNTGLAAASYRFAANGTGTSLASITPSSNTATSLPYWAALS